MECDIDGSPLWVRLGVFTYRNEGGDRVPPRLPGDPSELEQG